MTESSAQAQAQAPVIERDLLPAGPTDLADARVVFTEIFARLAADAGERDLARSHPFDLIRELTDAGFGRLRVPAAFGGHDVTLPELFEFLAQAGAADSNVPQILRGHFSAVEILRHTLQEAPTREGGAAAEHWLRRIAAGDVFGNAQSELAGAAETTRLHPAPTGAGWAVSGTKFYSTGSLFADHIRVAVVDGEGNRVFAVVPAVHPGVVHVDDWDGIGQRLTGSGTTHFDAVPVAEHGFLGPVATALRPLPAFFQIVHLANLAGIARSLRDETIEQVRSRRRTSTHALTQEATVDPEVLAVVGVLQARSLTADALLRTAAEGLEAAEADGSDTAYDRNYIEVSAAQVALIEAVLDAAARAFDAGGSSAIREVSHLDRHWRNARTLASHNPRVYKPRVVGDYLVNGTPPTHTYLRR